MKRVCCFRRRLRVALAITVVVTAVLQWTCVSGWMIAIPVQHHYYYYSNKNKQDRFCRGSHNYSGRWNDCLLLLSSSSKTRTAANGFSSSTFLASSPRPIDGNGWPYKFPAKEHCSKCGLCETTFVSRVKDACPFLQQGMGRLDQMETVVHGRGRNRLNELLGKSPLENISLAKTTTSLSKAGIAEEARFGVQYEPMRLVKAVSMDGAQWTGCVTSIAVAMLESGMVDAVVCIASSASTTTTTTIQGTDAAWCSPQPILAKTVDEVLRGRGVKPALAPSLQVLDQIRQDSSIRNLLFCGVGCAVQAFRAIQDELGLDQVYVLGTNCVDNSPTPQAAQNFLQQGLQLDDTTTARVKGYEFMPDFKVHVKLQESKNEDDDTNVGENDDSYYLTKPYFCLPGTVAKSAIAPSCLACFDYTNALADVVIGYMAAPYKTGDPMTKSYQTITIRNARGADMVQAASSRLQLGNFAAAMQNELGAHERLAMATLQSDALVQDMMISGTVREEGMPFWMGETMSWAMSTCGPKGVSFARYSIDYHILRNYLHVLHVWGVDSTERDEKIPQFARDVVQHYQTKFPALLKELSSKVAVHHKRKTSST